MKGELSKHLKTSWALPCSYIGHLGRRLKGYFVPYCFGVTESTRQGSKSLIIGERLNIRVSAQAWVIVALIQIGLNNKHFESAIGGQI